MLNENHNEDENRVKATKQQSQLFESIYMKHKHIFLL